VKRFISIIIILFILLVLVSCGKIPESSQTSSDTTQTSSNATQVKTNEKTTVTITEYYEEPQSIKDKSAMILGDLSSSEYVEMIVQGKITDFQLINVEFDSTNNVLIEKEITKQIADLENATIVLRTSLPEGIPVEKIKWKSATGKVYEYLIVDYGMADKNNMKQIFNLE